MYVEDQPRYLNAVGELTSGQAPARLLDLLHDIEGRHGRDRSRELRMGARTLDLDILLCGDIVQDDPVLIIPHPRLSERLFVLVPLLELSPRLLDPRTGVPYAAAMEQLISAGGPAETQGVYLYEGR
jgi:2-amino-4-hydroxy-6-hydroxymethyldihydropteridine diphosphokinase